MTDPDLLDAQNQAEALLSDAAEAVSLREQLAAAHAQLGEWREEVARMKRAAGARKCLDCGSLRFDRGGAAALDEARAVGFRQGVEAAAVKCEDTSVEMRWPYFMGSEDAAATLASAARRIRSLTLSDEAAKPWDCGPCRHQADGECALNLPVPDAGCSEFSPAMKVIK